MGIVNASPDSFSGDGDDPAGADIVDVGGESARTDRPAVSVAQEIERVVPVVQALAARGVPVSVDTYKPAVAEAAIAAGAVIVNDTSGLRDPELAEVCARTGAALVLMHTVGAPKEKVLDHRYEDVAQEVRAFLAGRIELAVSRGVPFESLLLDPGPDFGKSPAQTVAALRGLDMLHALERPLLLAISRKDFVGALTGRAPRQRGAGTLAAAGFAADAGAHVLRVHDVAATRDYLAVRAALRGEAPVDAGLRLDEQLRREE
jgi:dihydropteroate synthase